MSCEALSQASSRCQVNSRPIGVFDSGIGGLTVLSQIHKLLPQESTLYFGDTGRTPYGNKSRSTVRRYATQIAKFLLGNDVKMIVIACNTASAYAVEAVKEVACDVPVIEVVSPGALAATSVAKEGRIGVIGTKATVASEVYVEAILRNLPSATIVQKACPLFVGLAEEGLWHHHITKEVCEYYLSELRSYELEAVVLGCTHYPLLQTVIGQALGSSTKLVDSAEYTARRVKEVLEALNLITPAGEPIKHQFACSDDPDSFMALAEKFLPHRIEKVDLVAIEKYA